MRKLVVEKKLSVAVSKPMIGVALGVALFGLSYFSAASFVAAEKPVEMVCSQTAGGVCQQWIPRSYYSRAEREDSVTAYNIWKFSVMLVSFIGSLILLGVSFVNWYDK